MRNRIQNQGLTVNAVAGTHVVLLGLDLSDNARKGCLGFSIQRDDHETGETAWMEGMKTFEATDPGNLGVDGKISSYKHPFQSFQWCDYTVKAEHSYSYKVVARYGSPTNLTEGASVQVPITTEDSYGNTHSVFFNRGSVASQEYARRFQNKAPDELHGQKQQDAYTWLSRGLLEAFQEFVKRAKGSKYELFGAIYEFQWDSALEAIKEAAGTGAKVRILYDGIPGDSGPKKKNEKQIKLLKLSKICKPRTTGKIMHNKFLVLVKNGHPEAVWTGSTNLTQNGIFGHSNCGHVVEDSKVASDYLKYWNELKGNPDSATERTWMGKNNPSPNGNLKSGVIRLFSPRSGTKLLQWYADVAVSAQKALFMTFAFGMHKFFKDVYQKQGKVLKFALMEKEGNGKGMAQAIKDIKKIRALPNVVIALGGNIQTNQFDRWVWELNKIDKEAHVLWIHTKFMLVDPLGANPIIITGSANFSEASTNANNENMLVISGDNRVADIYLGEYMRMYSHYAFREAVAKSKVWNKTKVWNPKYLEPNDKWQADYYKANHQRKYRREYFRG
jgi:phosphatidylserine/phosphatidylglycerophosphate/cardiolipin synthase-like enzyme